MKHVIKDNEYGENFCPSKDSDSVYITSLDSANCEPCLLMISYWGRLAELRLRRLQEVNDTDAVG